MAICSTNYLSGAGSKLALTCVKLYDSGAYVSPGVGDSAVVVPFTSESFNPSGDDVTSAAIVGTRTVLDKEIVNKIMDGNFDVELTYEHWNYIFYAALGQVAESDPSAVISTTSTDIPNFLPKYNINIDHGSDFGVLVNCAIVNSLTLNIAPNSYVSASLDFLNGTDYAMYDSVQLGSSELASSTLISPIHLTDASIVTLGTGSFPAKVINDCVTSLSLTFNNNLDGSAMKLNGSGRMTVVPQTFNLTGNLVFQPTATTGTASSFGTDDLAALDVNSAISMIQLEFETGSKNAFLTVDSLKVTGVTHDISGQGLITVSVDFEAVGSGDPIGYGTSAGVTDVVVPAAS